MLDAIGNVFRIPELRKKILVTIGLLLCYRIGFHVPLPGVNFEALMEAASKQIGGEYASLFGAFNTFSAGNIGSLSLFSLGIMPYISASIIFSLLAKVVPTLEKLSKEGLAGQKKINQYSRYATVPLCIVQGFFVIKTIPSLARTTGVPLVDPAFEGAFWWQMMALVALTAGAVFLMWLGELITEYGIGNGISLLIMAGIIDRMPVAMLSFATQSTTETSQKIQGGIVMILLYVAVVLGVVYITRGHRRIPIQQARTMRGRRVYGGQRQFLPIKVNMAGVMPVIFASSLLIVPSIIFTMILHGASNPFNRNSWWYIVFYIGLIYFFAYFWTSLMMQPTEMANNMKEYGSFIPGIRPGRKTAEYLENVMIRITLAGATFLVVIALLPQLVSDWLDVSRFFTQFIGGTSILIVVGVALDVMDKINSHLLMRNYEGFMKRGRGGAGRVVRK
ncbi:MAG: preprotein translocase subunit SecY [Planctomycetes bacterium]|nr:preprotein translocase subunit SecY [Planctomycetota bacterium]MBI3846652.1 preprotein translocase subunit SecY [Planctomycetota bacterium]